MKLLVAALVGLFFAITGAAPMAAEPTTPSFDCRNAREADEKAVCASTELAKLDRLVTDAYAGFEPEYGDKKTIARDILADRKRCGDEVACITAVYADALTTYEGYYTAKHLWPARLAEALMLQKAEEVSAAEGPMPLQVGDCARTTIKALTDRFGAPLEGADATSGSAVEFTNGGSQVSYDREEGLGLSEVEDEVTTCLVSRVRDCPKDDDRGHTYVTFNESKHVFWVLTDTIHICGGA
jgi:uncharacterized protein